VDRFGFLHLPHGLVVAAQGLRFLGFLDVGGGVVQEAKTHAHIDLVQTLGEHDACSAEAGVVARLRFYAGRYGFR